MHSWVRRPGKESEVEAFKQRVREFSNVVKLVDLIEEQTLCSSEERVNLFFEKISSRLDEHEEVIHEESLVILEEALFGFQELRDSMPQRFMASDKMIFLNSDNEVRVWFHSDLVCNFPELMPRQPGDEEEQLIESVFHAVQAHCENRQFYPEFLRLWQAQPRPLRFGPAISVIRHYQHLTDSSQSPNPLQPHPLKHYSRPANEHTPRPRARFWS
jgi:hypothetical protein